ncbi:STAS domain-containing protein [Sulfurospirillum oryzae]|uniref:STAS domain-containing protein n=1 Tax=Sulfurospirillum oryzae TaxID=2976535 RepID=UPI0021E8C435|nr:STAS domain-containing protein [Sulfurospirillum oryzae]
MITLKESSLHVNPSGELTIYQVEEFSEKVKKLISSAERLYVDLSQLDKIDSAGFQLLVSLQKSCESSQKSFEINGITNSVHNFMLLFGFDWNTQGKGAE